MQRKRAVRRAIGFCNVSLPFCNHVACCQLFFALFNFFSNIAQLPQCEAGRDEAAVGDTGSAVARRVWWHLQKQAEDSGGQGNCCTYNKVPKYFDTAAAESQTYSTSGLFCAGAHLRKSKQ